MSSNYSFIDPANYETCHLAPYYPQEVYAISDRKNFDSMEQFSPSTLTVKIEFQQASTVPFNPEAFKNRKILVLLHGFKSPCDKVINTLLEIASKTNGVYDTVIAYMYPCLSSNLQYNKARVNATKVAHGRFPRLLNSLLDVASKVDIAAHSMGALVAMTTLNNRSIPIRGIVDNLFLFGGAVGEESLQACSFEGCSLYPRALLKVNDIYNIYSCDDEALPFHTLLEGEQTLGRPGQVLHFTPSNVKYINASAIIHAHSDYLTNDVVIQFMNDLVNSRLPRKHTSYAFDRRGNLYQSDHMKTCSVGYPLAIGRVLENGINEINLKINESMIALGNFVFGSFRIQPTRTYIQG